MMARQVPLVPPDSLAIARYPYPRLHRSENVYVDSRIATRLEIVEDLLFTLH